MKACMFKFGTTVGAAGKLVVDAGTNEVTPTADMILGAGNVLATADRFDGVLKLAFILTDAEYNIAMQQAISADYKGIQAIDLSQLLFLADYSTVRDSPSACISEREDISACCRGR